MSLQEHQETTMASLNEEDRSTIAAAEQYLQCYPWQTGPPPHRYDEEDKHLHPKKMLKAALDFAPTILGKLKIAKEIINIDNDSENSRNTRLENLSKEIYWSLLIPRKFSIFVAECSESKRGMYPTANRTSV
jgi:hypothetical protein